MSCINDEGMGDNHCGPQVRRGQTLWVGPKCRKAGQFHKIQMVNMDEEDAGRWAQL